MLKQAVIFVVRRRPKILKNPICHSVFVSCFSWKLFRKYTSTSYRILLSHLPLKSHILIPTSSLLFILLDFIEHEIFWGNDVYVISHYEIMACVISVFFVNINLLCLFFTSFRHQTKILRHSAWKILLLQWQRQWRKFIIHSSLVEMVNSCLKVKSWE